VELNVIVVCHRCYKSFKTLMEQDKEVMCPECFQELKLYQDDKGEKYFIGCPNCEKILTPIRVVEFMEEE